MTKRKEPTSRDCDVCGASFVPPNNTARRCSLACRTEADRRYEHARYRQLLTDETAAERAERDQRRRERQKSRSTDPQARARRRAYENRRRDMLNHRQRQRFMERWRTDPEFRLRKIQQSRHRNRVAPPHVIPFAPMWADQGGKCSLCGGQMNPVPILLGRGRDPLLASIEHRVPVADIGAAAHTPENVSLAHFVCNTRKGTKSLEEFFSTATMEA